METVFPPKLLSFTERLCLIDMATISLSEGPGLKFLPGNVLYSLRFSVAFLLYKTIAENLKIGHDRYYIFRIHFSLIILPFVTLAWSILTVIKQTTNITNITRRRFPEGHEAGSYSSPVEDVRPAVRKLSCSAWCVAVSITDHSAEFRLLIYGFGRARTGQPLLTNRLS